MPSQHDVNLAWCAGMVSVFGSMSSMRVNSPGRTPKYFMVMQFRRKGDKEPIAKFKRILQLGPAIRRDKTGQGFEVWNLRISGGTLETVIEKLWPYLSEERKQEYIQLDAEIQKRNEGILKPDLGLKV